MAPDAPSLWAIPGSLPGPFSLHPQRRCQIWMIGGCAIYQPGFLLLFFLGAISGSHGPSESLGLGARETRSCVTWAPSPCLWTKALCSWALTSVLDPPPSPLGKCRNDWLLKGRCSSRLASAQVKQSVREGCEEVPIVLLTLEWGTENDIDSWFVWKEFG